MTFGKLWLTLILMALLALVTACGHTVAPTPTVKPAPTATVTPTATPVPTPTATPYPFPEQTRAIGKLEPDDPVASGSEPFLLSGCYAGHLLGGGPSLPAFSSTAMVYGQLALVKGFKKPRDEWRRGDCYQMAVVHRAEGEPLRVQRVLGSGRGKGWRFDLVHPSAWRHCGRAPLPDLADIDC